MGYKAVIIITGTVGPILNAAIKHKVPNPFVNPVSKEKLTPWLENCGLKCSEIRQHAPAMRIPNEENHMTDRGSSKWDAFAPKKPQVP